MDDLGHVMEALAYDQSPLCDYLESKGTAPNTPPSPSSPRPSFAPPGLSQLRKRFRDARRQAMHLAKRDDDVFVERFRYLIIASQLLEEQSRPHPLQLDRPLAPPNTNLTLAGAIGTALLSFVVVWSVAALQYTADPQLKRTKYVWTITVCVGALAVVGLFGRRRYAAKARQSATKTLSDLLQDSRSFDTTFSTALRLVQEVEVISRGYSISQPLPPVSRFEDGGAGSRCEKLRHTLDAAVKSLLSECIDINNSVQRWTSEPSLLQYHRIYDVSLPEFIQAVASLNDQPNDNQLTLRHLRFSFEVLALGRKVVLCDLLALDAAEFWKDTRQWMIVADLVGSLGSTTQAATASIQTTLAQEESRQWTTEEVERTSPPSEPVESGDKTLNVPSTPEREQVQTQIRRLEGLANGVRTLNARMHVFREEVEGIQQQSKDPAVLSSVLMNQHELVGSELRSLLAEWEQSKRSMLLSVRRYDRNSRASSGIRSPVSPSPSLGGITAVSEDGPNEALRALNGEDGPRKLSDMVTSDDEVFEAMSLPKRQPSLLKSREERIAKLQEDRKKRATMHENQERTTSMLRELEMVIKHRPRGRTTSRIEPTTPF